MSSTHAPGNRSHQASSDRESEVDFILSVGDRRIPIEVKYRRRIDAVEDTLALKQFCEKSSNRAVFGLLVTRDDTGPDPDPRIVRIPASTLLLLR